MSARGEKLPVNEYGQQLILALINSRLNQGILAKHFDETQQSDGTDIPYAEAIAITAADITAQQLRFNVVAKFATAARVFTLNVYLQQTVS
jgi:hypothetical protein